MFDSLNRPLFDQRANDGVVGSAGGLYKRFDSLIERLRCLHIDCVTGVHFLAGQMGHVALSEFSVGSE